MRSHFFLSLVSAASAIVTKDVVVIGGGASGAYAAVRLRDDFSKDILLVEKTDRLGGHVASFTDPSTAVNYNYGVQSFVDITNGRDFFARHGVPVGPVPRIPSTAKYVDFTTGESVPFVAPTSSGAALQKFRQLAEQYESFMQPGYFNWPLPQDIPEDLVLPFGDFVKKHGIEDAVPTIFRITALGRGNITGESTLWVMQSFGAPLARVLLGQQEQYNAASGRNQDLYDAVAKNLGEDVLYSTTITASERTDDGVVLTLTSDTGEVTTVHAGKLLIAMAPTAKNLAPLDLDNAEQTTLSKFKYNANYCGLFESTQLPVNISYNNMPAAAAPNNYLEFPAVPFPARFDYFGDKYFRVIVVTDKDTSSEAAQAVVQQSFDNLVTSGVATGPEQIKWSGWAHHDALSWWVSDEDLKAGFFQDMNALQGRRSTYWTGAAFSAPAQTSLWEFDDILMPKIVRGCRRRV